MRLLCEQRNLLTRIEQAADGKHGIVFASIRIEKNRIPAVVDDLLASGLGITGMDEVEHPFAGSDDHVGLGQSLRSYVAVPLQPAAFFGLAPMHNFPPTDEVPMGHHNACPAHRKPATAHPVKV